MTWQPMDTAPKDGTSILVCLWGTSMVVASWDSHYEWLTVRGIGYAESAAVQWMPLPELPAALSSNQREDHSK
jgi:hypothetical protein